MAEVNTSTHPITVNGVRLDTLAYNIETKTGWAHLPSRRGGNAEVAGRHGTLFVPNKKFDNGQLTLSMWVSHLHPDGTEPVDKYHQWRKNLDTLMDLFDSSYSLIDVVMHVGPGDDRRFWCDLNTAVDPEMFGQIFGKFKISLDVPGVFGESLSEITQNLPSGTAAIGTHNLTSFAGGTAPMEDLKLRIVGPITNPTVTCVKSGHFVQYQGSVAAGEVWYVNAATSATRKGAGLAWNADNSGQNVSGQTVAGGAFLPLLFGLAHGSPPVIRLDGSGTGTGTYLAVRGLRKYRG